MNNLGILFVKILKCVFVALVLVISFNNKATAQISDNFVKSYSLNGVIYALNSDGEILLINDVKKTAEKISLTNKVNDICFYKGNLTIFSAIGEKRNKVEISELKNDNFVKTNELQIGDDFYISANCEEKNRIIITRHNLIFLKEHENKKIPIISIPERTNFSGIKTSNITNGNLYLGANRGEWGGFLYEINLKTGKFKSISAIGDDLCEGDFNPGCDPVNSIITSPWNKKCILFSIGLVHMLYSGQINEYCDGKLKKFFITKPEFEDKNLSEWHKNSTMPFYEIFSQNREIIALTPFGIFNIDKDAKFKKEKFKESSDYEGVRIYNLNKNYSVLMSGVNAQHALSGATPILVRIY